MRGSFSDAAAALDFTQPAVSQHISRLEAGARGARAGAQRPRRVADARGRGARPPRLRAARRRPAGGGGRPRRRGRRAARRCAWRRSRRPPPGCCPARRATCAARRPDAELTLQVHELEGALDALLAGRVDVAVIVDSALSPAKRRTGVEYLPICDDEMRIAVAADHPLATRSSVALEELSDEPFLITEVAGTCADSNVVLHAFADAGFEPTVRLRVRGLPGAAGDGGVRDRRGDDPDDGADELALRRRRAAAARAPPRRVRSSPRCARASRTRSSTT